MSIWRPSRDLVRHRREGFHLISQALDLEERTDTENQDTNQAKLINALYRMGVQELDMAMRIMANEGGQHWTNSEERTKYLQVVMKTSIYLFGIESIRVDSSFE